MSNYIGEFSALTAAFLWAISSVFYRFLGQKIPPLKLNFFKGIIAIAFILITLLFQEITIHKFEIFSFFLLFLSGIIGIGLGDTAYFSALNHLGVRKTLLLETFAPPMSATLAWIIMGETLAPLTWSGILLTLLGIIWVISEKSPLECRNTKFKGLVWGILAAISQSGGAVLSRIGLLNSNITSLESSLIRLIAGTGTVFLLITIWGNKKSSSTKTKIVFPSFHDTILIVLAAFNSTYLGIWLQQTSLKFAATGIAQTLLATSPIFAIIIAIIMKETVTLRSILGALIGIIGISLLFIK